MHGEALGIRSIQIPYTSTAMGWSDIVGRYTNEDDRDIIPFIDMVAAGLEYKLDENGDVYTKQRFEYDGCSWLGPFEKA